MSNQIAIKSAGWDHSKIIIEGAGLEALESALEYSSRALELQISELEKLSLVDGVMQTGIIATMARESIDTYRAAIDTIEELSGKLYEYLTASR
jgi:hypothetical protein